MKKIIALMLVLVFALTCFVACDKECEHTEPNAEGKCDECGEVIEVTNGVLDTIEYYANSLPTKIVSTSTQVILDDSGNPAQSLESVDTLVTGKIGGKIATVRWFTRVNLNNVVTGSGSQIVEPFETVTGSEEYLEGYGRRTTIKTDTDPGNNQWKPLGLNFGPTKGSIAIAITEDNVGEYTYTEATNNNVLSFTIVNDKIGEVFGTDEDGNAIIDADSDVTVKITNNGSVVTSIEISYTIKGTRDYPSRQVSMTTVYTYSVEEVQLLTPAE